MSNCAIYFDKDNVTYRLPVNPEQIETNSVQAIGKYEVLRLGQIAVPTHMELTEYSFEAEFPHQPLHYVETSGDFKDPDFYLNLFRSWRNNLEPVRFISSNGIGEDTNTLVLIEEVAIVEKAGEEGDKYVSFKLIEYREFSKKTAHVVENEILPFSVKPVKEEANPKSTGYHTVVSGDTLWAIAKKYYGDGSKCNIIFNANKDKIKNTALIKVGWKLKIPDKGEFAKYKAPLPSDPKTSKAKADRKKELEKMASEFASANKLDNVAGIGSPSPKSPNEYKGGVSDAGRTHSSGGRKIVVYESSYSAQGFRGGTSSSGRTHSSGGRKL